LPSRTFWLKADWISTTVSEEMKNWLAASAKSASILGVPVSTWYALARAQESRK
jgi:hypothetical protein